MIGYVAKERVDGKLVLPEAVKVLNMKGEAASEPTETTDPEENGETTGN